MDGIAHGSEHAISMGSCKYPVIPPLQLTVTFERHALQFNDQDRPLMAVDTHLYLLAATSPIGVIDWLDASQILQRADPLQQGMTQPLLAS
jgi:hypothetical protein